MTMEYFKNICGESGIRVNNAESFQNLKNYKKSLKRDYERVSKAKKISGLVNDIKTQKMKRGVCTRDVK